MRSFVRFPSVMLGVIVAFAMVVPAVAQTGTPSAVDEQPVGVLGEAQVDGLPSVAGEVWFIRFGLDPGGFIPLGNQIGPTVLVVESGELTIAADQPIEIDGSMVELKSGTSDSVVTAGQTAYVRENTAISLRNDGDAPVSTLALFTFSGMREVEEQEAAAGTPQPEPTGFSQQPLGVTQAEFPEGSGTVTIERVALESGATDRTDVPNGVIVGGVEHGSVDVAVESGSCFLWAGIMDVSAQGSDSMQGPGRDQLQAGGSGNLEANDGFGCSGAGIDWQAGDEGATIVRAVMRPLETPAAAASPLPIEAATPIAVAAEPLPTGVLAEVPVEALPSPDAEVWFIRYSLAPGGSLPPDMQIGPSVAYVESGELTVAADQPLQVVGGAEAASSTGETEVVVANGQMVYLPENTTVGARNDGDVPVVFDHLMIFSPQREVAAMESDTSSGEPQGLTMLGGGVTRASFPEGPGVIRIARILPEAGATVPYDATDGALVGWIEQGSATATVESGTCYILRPVPGGGDVDVEEIGPDHPSGVTSAELAVDNGFGCGNAVVSWQVGDAGLTVLIAEVIPAE